MAKFSRTKPAANVEYVGPGYTNGLRPYGFDHDIRPRDFDESTRAEFLAQYPEFSHWWAEPKPTAWLEKVEMPMIIEEPQPEEAA